MMTSGGDFMSTSASTIHEEDKNNHDDGNN